MKLPVLFLALSIGLLAGETITLTNGEIREDFVIVGYAQQTVAAKWKGGRGTVPYALLPEALRKLAEAKRPTAPKEEATNKSAPSLELRYDNQSVVLFSRQKEVLKNITVFINGTPPDGYRGFLEQLKSPMPGGIPLRSFLKKDGKRFQPSEYAITEIWVGAEGYENYVRFDPAETKSSLVRPGSN